jgi:hypothetical protein
MQVKRFYFVQMGDEAVTQERIGSKAQQVAFRTGETVPLSGVWRSEHESCKTNPEVWIRKDELFPPCPQCGSPASFTLVEAIQHISEDSDFQ